MNPAPTTRVLCVDDEPHVLDALARILRRRFDVTVAVGAEQALAHIEAEEPFAVVMSDQRMAGIDGVTLLSRVRGLSPDAVRILLTGYADTGSAIRAVNEGAVFRFLTKPIGQDELQRTLTDAAEQHRLITAERVLQEETLHGSIRAVTDILALVNPAGFGRALRAKEIVGELSSRLKVTNAWQIEIAAMLSQVGTVTLSNETVRKLYHGQQLTLNESLAVARLPKVAADLVGNIPRMDEVQTLLANMGVRYDGSNSQDGSREAQIPLGSRMLKVALDFDILESQGLEVAIAIETLRGRKGCYDPTLLDTLAAARGAGPPPRVREIELRRVEIGMILADDVRTETGMLLIARGQQVTPRMVDRIRGTLSIPSLRQLVRVTLPPPPEAKTQGEGETVPAPGAEAEANEREEAQEEEASLADRNGRERAHPINRAIHPIESCIP